VAEPSMRAKVFISCGQASEVERAAARQIGEVLDSLGFDYYIAVEEQTLKGLKENIFAQLESSEYFLFIDFRREQLANVAEYRGSLFSHQELAVASYLDLPVMAFRHKGVRPFDGLMGFLQANALEFDDPADLPPLLGTELPKRGWSTGWKNALVFEEPGSMDIERVNQEDRPARFFHLPVKNLHPRKIAQNCLGYVERIERIGAEETPPLLSTELRWAGYALPQATILPDSTRLLDAGFVFHDVPNTFLFNSFSTSSRFAAPIRGPAQFRLTYVVVGPNFPPSRATVFLALGGTSIGQTSLKIEG